MASSYLPEHLRSEANPMPTPFFETEEYRQSPTSPEIFDSLAHTLSPEQTRELAQYFDRVMPVAATA